MCISQSGLPWSRAEWKEKGEPRAGAWHGRTAHPFWLWTHHLLCRPQVTCLTSQDLSFTCKIREVSKDGALRILETLTMQEGRSTTHVPFSLVKNISPERPVNHFETVSLDSILGHQLQSGVYLPQVVRRVTRRSQGLLEFC